MEYMKYITEDQCYLVIVDYFEQNIDFMVYFVSELQGRSNDNIDNLLGFIHKNDVDPVVCINVSKNATCNYSFNRAIEFPNIKEFEGFNRMLDDCLEIAKRG